MAESKLSPLQHNVQIVNPDGTPTPYFIQLLQQLYEEKDAIDGQVELTAGLDLIAGAGLSGGGPLDGSAGDITLSADVQAILNLVSTTRGAILYRGAAVWSALLPGTAGYFLKTNGAGADPAWAAAGGGGGGGTTPTIRSITALQSSSWASFNVPLPAGTAVGDVVVVFQENGYGPAAYPVGWTPMAYMNNGWTNGYTVAKVITAGDIATGYVTVNAGGNFNGVTGAVCLTGANVNALDQTASFGSAGSASFGSGPITGLAGSSPTDLVIGMVASRGTMNVAVSAGLTVLSTVNGANASGVLFSATGAAIGKLGLNETATFPVGNNGYLWSAISFK